MAPNYIATFGEPLFESAFKFSPIGMALLCPNGKWLKANQALLDLMGYEEAEFLSLSFEQLTHPEDLKRDMELAYEILDGKRETYQLEKRYIHKNGEIIYALLSVSLIKNPDGTPKVFISQIQDLTAHKKAQANIQANSKLMALGEMSAGIAHEINNPLAIIHLHSRILEQLVVEENLNREMISSFTHKINETVNRISCIISSLRKFSSKHSQLRFEQAKLSTIVEDALGLCKEKFRSHGVMLTISMPDDVEVECNPVEISQILINLMNNAFYAIQEQREKEISISAKVVRGKVYLSVMDSGPGIAPEVKNKIMDPFFTTKPFGEGTGLGLSISKSIIQAHQGELYLDDKSAKTNFVVKLPLKQPQLSKRSLASKTAERMLPM